MSKGYKFKYTYEPERACLKLHSITLSFTEALLSFDTPLNKINRTNLERQRKRKLNAVV